MLHTGVLLRARLVQRYKLAWSAATGAYHAFPDSRQCEHAWSWAILADKFQPIRSVWCTGTLLTARLALRYKLACNTAGGTHHAFPDSGSGFCIINDIAITARVLLQEGLVERVLILDLDVHQVDHKPTYAFWRICAALRTPLMMPCLFV